MKQPPALSSNELLFPQERKSCKPVTSVLLVHAEQELGISASTALSKRAYTVDWVRDTLSARGLASTKAYDLIVLDLDTFDQSKCDVEDLVHSGQPKFLVLSESIWLFDGGRSPCDLGYLTRGLTKPFTVDELLAGVEALER